MPRGQGKGMDTVRVAIDSALFDNDTIARAMHRYTGDFFVEFSRSGPEIVILLTPMRVDVDTINLPQRFANDLLDERLRAKIRAETGVLHATLVRTALREASPSGPTAEPVP
jgi:His-Xaa-Ser system protein HxsD